MAVTVGDVLGRLNVWAPIETAEKWDNVGLLVGDPKTPVTRVLTALDVSPFVIEQAVRMNANLIVSHHPVIFHPIDRLTADDIPYQLARRGLSAIGMHTNLDRAACGVNDVLAESLGLNEVAAVGDGLCRIGILSDKLEPEEFAAYVGRRLQVPEGGVQWISGKQSIQTVGVCSGAGGDYVSSLLPKVDAMVTGELHYHEWPLSTDKTIIAAGHYYTEVGIAKSLAGYLAEAFPMLAVSAAEEQCPYRQL